MTIFGNGLIFLEGRFEDGLELAVEKGRIAGIMPLGTVKDGDFVDAQGGYIVPGFIDIHIHGSVGCDVMDARTGSLERIASFLAKNGTTSFLATTMTLSADAIRSSIEAAAEFMKQEQAAGAQCLGIHLEGPFLNPDAKGAHDETYLIDPSVESFNTIIGDNIDIIRLVTMAPELDGAAGLTSYLKARGIKVSIGHTRADYDTACRAIDLGMDHTCHFYNAMTPLKHRDPGVVGAVLDHGDNTVELISDLIHIHPAALRLAVKVKGCRKCALITDAMAAAGLGDGIYNLGGLEVHVEMGAARLKDGTLAGSTLTQGKALKNMVGIGVPLEDTITMLTSTPASIIGASAFKGHLKAGWDADVVILDRDLNVVSAYVKGIRQF